VVDVLPELRVREAVVLPVQDAHHLVLIHAHEPRVDRSALRAPAVRDEAEPAAAPLHQLPAFGKQRAGEIETVEGPRAPRLEAQDEVALLVVQVLIPAERRVLVPLRLPGPVHGSVVEFQRPVRRRQVLAPLAIAVGRPDPVEQGPQLQPRHVLAHGLVGSPQAAVAQQEGRLGGAVSRPVGGEHVVPDVVGERDPEQHQVRAVCLQVLLEDQVLLVRSVAAGAEGEDLEVASGQGRCEMLLEPPLRHLLQLHGVGGNLRIAQQDHHEIAVRVFDPLPAEAELVRLARRAAAPSALAGLGVIEDAEQRLGDDKGDGQARQSKHAVAGARSRAHDVAE